MAQNNGGTDSNSNGIKTVADTFTPSDKYTWYDEYEDENYSFVSDAKVITVDPSEINLTQETHSQYIPFSMSRYYDGIDLMDMTLIFHYVNPEGFESYSAPVNVSYSSDTIHFAWLVDENVTAVVGTVTFEIRADGVNEKGETYIWRTRPDGELHVLRSLDGNGVAVPSNEWLSAYIADISTRVLDIFTAELETDMEQIIIDYVTPVLEEKVNSMIDEALDGYQTKIQELMTEYTSNYYTKDEVDAWQFVRARNIDD